MIVKSVDRMLNRRLLIGSWPGVVYQQDCNLASRRASDGSWQFRGAFRSRRFESVGLEASRLFREGVREINLIGQDTTSYGEDLGIKDGLAHLLARLAAIDTPHDKWVRFLYAYPNRVNGRLLDTIAEHDALVKYIDMPLQHSSASVLKRMKRGSSGDLFLKLIERIRETIPGVAIRTSMIVGFPGETQQDFDELCQFVEAARFDRLGVFSFSDEETAGSFGLDSKVDRRTIYNRKRRLMFWRGATSFFVIPMTASTRWCD